MSSVSTGTSHSQSQSTYMPQPADQYEAQWNQALTNLQSQQYAWGQQQYAKSSALTDTLVNQALNYASPDRIHNEMGAAEAGVQQSGQAARANLQQQLQSYGVNPGDPEYAGALAAADTQTGAAAAAAGNNARRATTTQGIAMTQQAQQAELANVASGANTMGTAGQYAQDAVSNVKFGPLGNQSSSTSQQQSVSSDPAHPASPSSGGSSGGGGGSQGGGGGGVGGGGSTPYPGQFGGGGGSFNSDNGGGYSQPGSEIQSIGGGSSTAGGGGGDSGGGIYDGSGSSYNDPGYPSPGSDGNYPADPGGGQYSQMPSSWDQNTPSAEEPFPGGGGGNYDPSSGGDYSGDFAKGGEVPGKGIPDGTTGGFVSRHLSPSGGAETDDVPAHLNADEFVVPRDTVKWKGEEFFHKLIEQSRQARQNITAKPTMQQKPTGHPSVQRATDRLTQKAKPTPAMASGGAVPGYSDDAAMMHVPYAASGSYGINDGMS